MGNPMELTIFMPISLSMATHHMSTFDKY